MGANRPRDIHELCEVAAPDVAVLTSIGRAHIEGFGGTVDDVRRAKSGIFSHSRTRLAVVPGSEARNAVVASAADATKNVVTFGDEGSTIVATRTPASNGPVVLRGNGVLEGFAATFDLRYHGIHNAQNLAAAVLACSMQPDGALRAPPADLVARAMARLDLPAGRLRSVEVGGRTLIDDAYNANPDSVAASLGILAAAPAPRVAVLGDMFELGEAAAELHSEVGQRASQCADIIAGVGAYAPHLVRAAGSRGHAFATADQAAEWLAGNVPVGSTVLIKGSRGMRLERVVHRLIEAWGGV
jgi:UDP-N-acetylmuramoyl-tripeptide--D-alanyl-D-alanine ligase